MQPFFFTAFISLNTPLRIVAGFVETTAFKGVYAKNPYNFLRKFGGVEIEECRCFLNGVPLENYPRRDSKLSYLKTFVSLDFLESGSSNGMTYKDFEEGSFFSVFDFTTSNNAGILFQVDYN